MSPRMGLMTPLIDLSWSKLDLFLLVPVDPSSGLDGVDVDGLCPLGVPPVAFLVPLAPHVKSSAISAGLDGAVSAS